MDPNTGDAFRLRSELVDDMKIGDRLDMDELREKVARLEQESLATDDEISAAAREQLVAISETAAHKIQLGERELARRRRRRQQQARSRRRNR